jgi:hypothetical protein
MFWECSECDGRLERHRPPVVCPSCGIAGAIFVPAEMGAETDPTSSSLREAWLLAGFHAADVALDRAEGP